MAGGMTRIAQYTRQTATSANPTGTVLLSIAQPQANHNGGWMGFGPDGRLYIATGDGGNANDTGPDHFEPGGNAQTTTNLLGKMLASRPSARAPRIPSPAAIRSAMRFGTSGCATRGGRLRPPDGQLVDRRRRTRGAGEEIDFHSGGHGGR